MITSPVICQYRHVSILSYDRSHHPATQILSPICHMTGEVIIQLPDYVSILTYDWRMHHPATQILSLYCYMTGEVIIQLPDHVFILSYDRRIHHPATRIMSLCCHMTGEVIIQLPRYCLYTDIWQEKSSSSYPDTVSILTHDRRSHHPATQVLSLCCHMTGEVIMTSPVIWQYRDSIWVAGWWFLLSYDSIDMIWAAGWWLLKSYDSIETVSG
jgi:hypothetical protein